MSYQKHFVLIESQFILGVSTDCPYIIRRLEIFSPSFLVNILTFFEHIITYKGKNWGILMQMFWSK